MITFLQELRTRLISDIVTGQVDVRGIEIPEFEYVAEESDRDEGTNDDNLDDSEAKEE